jgi:hypothetical protein
VSIDFEQVDDKNNLLVLSVSCGIISGFISSDLMDVLRIEMILKRRHVWQVNKTTKNSSVIINLIKSYLYWTC